MCDNREKMNESWKSFKDEAHRLDEITRQEIDDLASADGDFLSHDYRTSNEIEAGSIKLLGLSDGELVFMINPFGNGPPRIPGLNANWRNKVATGKWDTTPGTPGAGAPYTLRVKFVDWERVMDMDLTPREKALNLIQKDSPYSDVQLYCSCPSFKFHYQYVANQHGASIEPESRPPENTNPDRRGVMCKHARRINNVYPFYWAFIAGNIANGGYDYAGPIYTHRGN